jgi:ubiquinone biosynthesis protein UbiJ
MKMLLNSTIEKALNTYLLSDEHAQRQLKKLAGRAIAVELKPLAIVCICQFHEDRVLISDDGVLRPDTKITGTPLDLLTIAIDKKNRQQFFADDVAIEGDAEFAQQVVDLFDHVEIDWEEHTSRIIGDVPAVQLGKLVRGIRNFFSKSESALREDVSDYLHEEAAWFPQQEELREFSDDVDTLRMDTDRLEARLSHLRSLLDKGDTE